jgi:putative ABC transport system substrate-binding protein
MFAWTSAGGAGDAEHIRRYAAELVALAPDVILASGTTTLGPLRQVSRIVPTVFTGVGDAVGAVGTTADQVRAGNQSEDRQGT